MDGFEKCMAVMFMCIALLGLGACATSAYVTNRHLDFDKECVRSGKNLTYITLPGSDYAKKVCLLKVK